MIRTVNDNMMPPRWLFYLAVFTAVCASVLLYVGAVVTTMRVGMADQRSFVMPNQAISEMATGEQSIGWVIEHSHRLAAWLVGFCILILAISCQVVEHRLGVRMWAIVALLLVVAQAMLGKYRVQLNDWWGPGLVWIHGCFAQIVFATLVILALVMSPAWNDSLAIPAGSARTAANSPDSGEVQVGAKLRRWSLVCVALVFCQLMLGGMVRNLHADSLLLARLHLIGAFVILGILMVLIRLAMEQKDSLLWPAHFLAGALVLQILLGVESLISWMARFFDPSIAIREPFAMILIRSGHYLAGSIIFASCAAIAVTVNRGASLRASLPMKAQQLEGAL